MKISSQDQAFIAHLKSSSERVTSPRLAIFRILGTHSPLAMASLSLRAQENGVDSVTVYRTLALFKKLGLVQEIGVGNKRLFELSDGFGGHHHHFWCTNCGKIIDFDDPNLEQALHQATAALNFTLQSHQLEMVGVCSSCRKQR